MSAPKVLFGFHAVGVRLKTAPASIVELYVDPMRRDARMKQFLNRAAEAGARVIEADAQRLMKLCGSAGHQGVVARVQALEGVRTLDELLDDLQEQGAVPLLLVLDGVTDPHNLGACLRVADGAGERGVDQGRRKRGNRGSLLSWAVFQQWQTIAGRRTGGGRPPKNKAIRTAQIFSQGPFGTLACRMAGRAVLPTATRFACGAISIRCAWAGQLPWGCWIKKLVNLTP